MSDFKYFNVSDFDCQETGENEMSLDFIGKLDHLRAVLGWPMVVTSGYRSPNHSLERSKPNGGAKGFVHLDCRDSEPVSWVY